MSNRPDAAVCAFLLLATVSVSAVKRTDTPIGETGVMVSSTATERLSPTERTQARAWDLSATQWRRYKELMQGVRGSISPAAISPIEVLGIHARDQDERRRYAEMWARAMREDVSRILAFQHAYDEAGRRLYPNEQLIDLDRLPGRGDKTGSLQPGDRVLFFTRPDCPACDALLGKLLKHIDNVAAIDIYITGVKTGDDQAVRDWAADHSIKPEWVHSHRVTLNHEVGVLERLTQGKGKIPYILRRQGKDLSVLRASEL